MAVGIAYQRIGVAPPNNARCSDVVGIERKFVADGRAIGEQFEMRRRVCGFHRGNIHFGTVEPVEGILRWAMIEGRVSFS